jgi:sugar/nucleoside kinase (ribokinase family)
MTANNTLYDVVTVGNYTKDTIVTPAGTRYGDGGGFNYAARAAAGLGCRVAAVTRLAAEDRHVIDGLEASGIDAYPVYTPESTLMRLEYPTANVDERILSVAATAGSFTADQVAPIVARAFLISGSIRGELPLEVMQVLGSKDALVSADIQGFIRIRRPDGRLEHTAWPERREFLGLVDILKTDAVEAEALTGERDIRAAARAAAELGPREIVLTHRGGLLVLAGGEYHEVPFHPREVVGRSGRGDTCLGSYVASRLSVAPAEATIWAAAVTSLKMEADGPFNRDIDAVVDLIQREYGKVANPPHRVLTTTVGTNRGP